MSKQEILEITELEKCMKSYINLYFMIIYCIQLLYQKNQNLGKPNPGMLLKANKIFKINLKKSYLIGDRWSDIEAGEKSGMQNVFIDRNYKIKKTY